MATRGRNPLLYMLLGAVALASVAFHFRSVEQVFPQWFGIVRAEWPFLLDAEDKPYFRLQFLNEVAQDAGLRAEDQLIAIDSLPVQSRSAFADLLLKSRPGSTWDVFYRRKAQSSDHTARLSLRQAATQMDPIEILAFLAMPVFCLGLGCWVVSVRLNDLRTWLLLGFLLSVATAFDNFPYLWEPG